jgi:dephospho-CoA kinase
MEKALGCTLRNEQGELDKAVLANLIFADDKARAKVNALVHPQVVEDFQQWAVGQSTAWVAIESALFLSPQAGARLDAEAVIYVDAPESLRIQRILSRGGATLEQAQARVAAQDISAKDARVSHVLVNDGT